MSNYNPYAVPRRVRVDFITSDGIVVAKSKSFTDADDDDDRYHPSVDLATGECECNCKDFHFRRTSQDPDLTRPDSLCKHLKRLVANLEARGDIQKPRRAPRRVAAPVPAGTPMTPLHEWNAQMAAKRAQSQTSADWRNDF